MEQQEETRSSFLLRNLLRGLVWFAVIITIFIFLEDYLQENFQHTIEELQDRPLILFSVFFASEILFGLLPPEFFMMVWVLHKVPLGDYVVDLSILTVFSFAAGIIGYFVGRFFSKTLFFKKIRERYLQQYESQLRRYGGYLVFVGAVTPVPFSATCMLAGSVEFNFRDFVLICLTRILRFVVYGWMVWSFPDLFAGIAAM